jgi:colanic acid biosynthesis glycosyl transferase WcaI
MAAAYRRCDVIVDIGSTMRRRLADYASGARQETLVPWALVEPPTAPAAEPLTRAALFPNAKLGLLYAGTMGRAHDFETILTLARACRAASGQTISFCFACRGNRLDELQAAIGEHDTNISFAPFSSEADLPVRLAAADLHIVSMRPEWQGIVVPSKFFASLASGRPVLFAGPKNSEIAEWTSSLGVGLSLVPGDDVTALVGQLHELASDAAALAAWQSHAHAVYATHFSKRVTNDRWNQLLREALAGNRGDNPSLKAVGRRV